MFSDGLEVAPLVPHEISHYRIIDKLGSGGMGEVFLAQDVRLDRKVAIKMLPAKSIGNEQAKKRLFREAKAAATLDHPNICAIYEVGEEGDCAYIAMQYIEGRTLSHIIKNNALSPLEVVDIGIQATEALAEAHSRGVIHRDIKPQNVIITPRGRVKILDFGLAKILRDEGAIHTGEIDSRLTETGEVVGTVGYMSPEQLRDLPIDARSDLFSLGVMLYECATGKSAFVGSTKIQISLQVIEVDPQKPSELSAAVPGELDAIILKALAKDVDARYQSADAMLADLRRMEGTLQGSVLNTRPLTPQGRSFRSTAGRTLSGEIRRVPVRVKVGLGIIALLIFGSWSALRILHRSPNQPSAEARNWYDRGLLHMHEGTYYQASKELEQAILTDDGFALAHARLAAAYVEIDNTDKAMEELLHALSLVSNRSVLASQDAAYLDAVAATVRREFPKAIEHYRQLAVEAPDQEKANAYVDLARAYERNDDIDKAQEYYLEATKKDPQSAAAFLRVAILYGRRQDPKADDAFNEAERIYKIMSNQEGVAETYYQRGALLAKLKRLPEAKARLEDALKLAQNLPENKYELVKTQLQLSGVYDSLGDSELAKKVATEAIEVAQKNRIQNLATNGLIDLGYTFLSRDEFNEAGKYFQQALDFAQRDKARAAEARAKRALGSLNQQQGNFDAAIPLLEEARNFYQTSGYRKEASGASLLLGRAYRDKGDYEVAFKAFGQTLELAKELGDSALMASCNSSFAILLGERQERYPEALSYLDESYKINESLNAKKDMAYDKMNLGSFLWQLGRYADARAALDQAFSIASRPEANFKGVLAWVHLTNARIALSERRFAETRDQGQQALTLAGTEIGDVLIHAKHSIGLALAFSGAAPAGRTLCQDAVARARESKSPQLISSALLALAEAMLLSDDAHGALATAQEAQAMFAKSGQQDSEWRALLIEASASQTAGNKQAMQDYATRANALCAGLQDKWGQAAYDSYLQRPDILAYRKQMAEILSRKN